MRVQIFCVLSVLLLLFFAPMIEHTDANRQAVKPQEEGSMTFQDYCLERKNDLSHVLNLGLQTSRDGIRKGQARLLPKEGE